MTAAGKLILYRIGLFDDSLCRDITLCPYHRYKQGIYFKQNQNTCSNLSHSGNRKAYRGITVSESIDVLESFSVLLPVVTCKLHVSSFLVKNSILRKGGTSLKIIFQI